MLCLVSVAVANNVVHHTDRAYDEEEIVFNENVREREHTRHIHTVFSAELRVEISEHKEFSTL